MAVRAPVLASKFAKPVPPGWVVGAAVGVTMATTEGEMTSTVAVLVEVDEIF